MCANRGDMYTEFRVDIPGNGSECARTQKLEQATNILGKSSVCMTKAAYM